MRQNPDPRPSDAPVTSRQPHTPRPAQASGGGRVLQSRGAPAQRSLFQGGTPGR